MGREEFLARSLPQMLGQVRTFAQVAICDDAKGMLRELYRKIHPDLFHGDEKARVCAYLNIFVLQIRWPLICKNDGQCVNGCRMRTKRASKYFKSIFQLLNRIPGIEGDWVLQPITFGSFWCLSLIPL